MKTKICPQCKHAVKAEATFCPYCGFKFKARSRKATKNVKLKPIPKRKTIFCPNCGHPVIAGTEFCPNCGFNLKTKLKKTSKTPQDKAQSSIKSVPAQKHNQATELTTKAKIIISVLVVLLIACVGFYFWGNNHYSKNNQIDQITSALGNPKQNLVPYVVADTQNMKVTPSSIKPLQNYYHEHQTAVTKMTQELKDGIDPNSQISLVENGHYLLFFPKYQLQIKTFQPQVITNHANSVVTVNGKKIGALSKQNGKYYKKLALIFPGKYNFKVNSKVAGRNLTASSTANIWNNKTLNMEIRTQTFKVKSVPNGVIYINDQKVGSLNSSGELTFKSYPITKNMQLYVVYHTQGKNLKSDIVTDMAANFGGFDDATDDEDDNDYSDAASDENSADVTKEDGVDVVTPKWPGLINKDDAKSMLDDDFTDPDESDFVNGSANKYYQQIKQQVDRWNGDDYDGFEAESSIESIYPADKNESQVNYKVNYTIHKDDYDLKQVVEYTDGLLVKKDDHYVIKTIGDGKLISSHKENTD